MSGKIRNPERRCKICGNKCEKRMRYCKLCAREVKEIRERREGNVFQTAPSGGTTRAALGLGGIYRTPPEALAVVEKEIAADVVTMNPPLTMGGYLCDLLPVVKGGAD